LSPLQAFVLWRESEDVDGWRLRGDGHEDVGSISNNAVPLGAFIGHKGVVDNITCLLLLWREQERIRSLGDRQGPYTL